MLDISLMTTTSTYPLTLLTASSLAMTNVHFACLLWSVHYISVLFLGAVAWAPTPCNKRTQAGAGRLPAC